MPTLSLKPPADYLLKRDACSYGYFLLAPNYWDVKRKAVSRVFTLSAGPVGAVIEQRGTPGAPLRITLSRSLRAGETAMLIHQIARMLRLDEDADLIAAFHKADPRFAPSGRGRLMRSPTLFEDVIKTVTSCNVTWPSTVHMNARLCGVLGKKLDARGGAKDKTGMALAGFPSEHTIARTKPATLRSRCRVGYRDARIVELAKLFRTSPQRGGLDQEMLESPATPDDAVFEYLVELPGIGPYAAANIMQLLGRYGRLPLDTESVRHGKSLLDCKGTSSQVMNRMKKHYKPFGPHAFRSYWFELWDFYESKHGPAHTWERDSTGRMFTAALLNKA